MLLLVFLGSSYITKLINLCCIVSTKVVKIWELKTACGCTCEYLDKRRDVMSEREENGFDPLRDQAANKSAKERSNAKHKALRFFFSVILLLVLIVVGMYAVGGTGEFSEWMSVRKSLGAFGSGTVSQQESEGFVELVSGIESVRGNQSALAGVYCVYALQMLADGNIKNAGYTLRILNKDYASKQLFAELWDRNNLTEECKACSSKSKKIKCSNCNGSGRLPLAGNKLKNSRRMIHRLGSDKDVCTVCNGTGKVSVNTVSCKSCGGSGRVLSQSAVSLNLEKALRKAKVLVNLKCLQCALSLRPLFGNTDDVE